MSLSEPNNAAISVSQLNRQVKTLIEQGMARVCVEGEISNWSRPASGHIYLSLKDDAAQISAAWFRQRQRGPASGFKNGDRVLAYGRVSLYEARGNYQLIIEQLEPAGEGVLKRRYDALKKKLEGEGLFDASRKQALPLLPRKIGVITSPTGAALRDVLSVLRRRFAAVPVVIFPAAVQGDAAPGELVAALDKAIERDDCDVLIIGRGGGSLEDLWAFNDESLARRIADCPIPIVSAVGHEVDFTIADFVADVRAATPSGAAELVVPDNAEWLQRLTSIAARFTRVGRRTLDDRAQQLDWLSRRLLASSPRSTLQRQRATLRELSVRMAGAARKAVAEKRGSLHAGQARLLRQSPALSVQRSIAQLAAADGKLQAAILNCLAEARHRTAILGRALHSVSPLATLDRGYAIVLRDDNNKALLDSQDVSAGDTIRARLAKGGLLATVNTVLPSESNDD